MANIAASLSILLSITGGQLNLNEQSPAILAQMPNSPGYREQITLGTNTVIVPPQAPSPAAKFALIIPPSSSAIAKTLKGIVADTGYSLGTSSPILVPIGTSAGPDGNIGSFIINAGGAEPVWVYWL